MKYNCKVNINNECVFDKDYKSLKEISTELQLPYQRIADIHSRPYVKNSKFIYEPQISITKIKKEEPPQ